jgi:geranylgeranyl diphosphate synthase, type I
MPTSGHPSDQAQFVAAVNSRVEAFLAEKKGQVTAIAAQSAPLVDSLIALSGGGKKLRPVLAWIGWRAASGEAGCELSDPQALFNLAAALELFQAAALVHDDVIDRSATRRSQPSVHVQFQERHRAASWSGDTAHFGTTGAILSGDLALSWASELFELASEALPGNALRAGRVFRRMHTEVITGQYLDVVAEVAGPNATEAEALRQARTVLTYKSAKYSTEYPMELGCTLAGGSPELASALAEAALPLGIAFQLRDDLLGVFGDAGVTGKPVGDDLREGKRTELIAYALHRAPEAEAAELESMLGDPDLTEPGVVRIQEILTTAGALSHVEAEIRSLTERSADARSRLTDFGVSPEVLHDFDAVAERLVSRTS